MKFCNLVPQETFEVDGRQYMKTSMHGYALCIETGNMTRFHSAVKVKPTKITIIVD